MLHPNGELLHEMQTRVDTVYTMSTKMLFLQSGHFIIILQALTVIAMMMKTKK